MEEWGSGAASAAAPAARQTRPREEEQEPEVFLRRPVKKQHARRTVARLTALPPEVEILLVTTMVGSTLDLRATCRQFWLLHPPSVILRMLADTAGGTRQPGFRIAKALPDGTNEVVRTLKELQTAGRLPARPLEMQGSRNLLVALVRCSAQHNNRDALDHLLLQPAWRSMYESDRAFYVKQLCRTPYRPPGHGPVTDTAFHTLLLDGAASEDDVGDKTAYFNMLCLATHCPESALAILQTPDLEPYPQLYVTPARWETEGVSIWLKRSATTAEGLTLALGTHQHAALGRIPNAQQFQGVFREAHTAVLEHWFQHQSDGVYLRHGSLLPATAAVRLLSSRRLNVVAKRRILSDVVCHWPSATEDAHLAPSLVKACKEGSTALFYQVFPAAQAVIELVFAPNAPQRALLNELSTSSTIVHPSSGWLASGRPTAVLLQCKGGVDWQSHLTVALLRHGLLHLILRHDFRMLQFVEELLVLPCTRVPEGALERIADELRRQPLSQEALAGSESHAILVYDACLLRARGGVGKARALAQLYTRYSDSTELRYLQKYRLLPDNSDEEANAWRLPPLERKLKALFPMGSVPTPLALRFAKAIVADADFDQLASCAPLLYRCWPGLLTSAEGRQVLAKRPGILVMLLEFALPREEEAALVSQLRAGGDLFRALYDRSQDLLLALLSLGRPLAGRPLADWVCDRMREGDGPLRRQGGKLLLEDTASYGLYPWTDPLFIAGLEGSCSSKIYVTHDALARHLASHALSSADVAALHSDEVQGLTPDAITLFLNATWSARPPDVGEDWPADVPGARHKYPDDRKRCLWAFCKAWGTNASLRAVYGERGQALFAASRDQCAELPMTVSWSTLGSAAPTTAEFLALPEPVTLPRLEAVLTAMEDWGYYDAANIRKLLLLCKRWEVREDPERPTALDRVCQTLITADALSDHLARAFCTRTGVRHALERPILGLIARGQSPFLLSFLQKIASLNPLLLRLEREHLPGLCELLLHAMSDARAIRDTVASWKALFMDAAPTLHLTLDKRLQRSPLKQKTSTFRTLTGLWVALMDEEVYGESLQTTQSKVDWFLQYLQLVCALQADLGTREPSAYVIGMCRRLYVHADRPRLHAGHMEQLFWFAQARRGKLLPDSPTTAHRIALLLCKLRIPLDSDAILQLHLLQADECVQRGLPPEQTTQSLAETHAHLSRLFGDYTNHARHAHWDPDVSLQQSVDAARSCRIQTFPMSLDLRSPAPLGGLEGTRWVDDRIVNDIRELVSLGTRPWPWGAEDERGSA